VSAVRIESLRFAYGGDPGRLVLDGIDLDIGGNDFAAILGQNGSGKTTLLKNVSGLLRPMQGKITIRGTDSAGMSVAEIAGEVGYVMQDCDNQLFEQTVFEEVAFALKLPPKGRGAQRLARAEVRRRVEESLETLGLQDSRDAFPPALCKADRVKTVFAAVLAMGARILLLDEPLAGQDSRGSRMIMEILADLHRKGCAVVLVTHNIRVAAEYAQRLVVMSRGRVILDGSAAEVFDREGELACAGILLPGIPRLSRDLQGHLPLDKPAATPAELAGVLASLAKIHTKPL